jgi:DNA-binding transcriptional LysR family regulator
MASVPHKFDLNLLPIALALYDELSVSRAARSLGMSQPAVSMALRKMRAAFNDPMFIRSARGITPTPRAHALIRVARPLFANVHETLLADDKFNPHLSSRPFVFALSDVGEMVFLPKLLERLRAAAPNATIKSVSMLPDRLADALEVGDVDLAIGYFPDLNKSNFFQQRLFTHHFACLMRAGHPRRAERISRDDFMAMEHAVVRAEGRSQEIVELYLARKGIRRNIVLLSPHFLSLPIIISRSDLVATVPHALALYFARLLPDLAVARPPFDIGGFDVKQHWHRKFHTDARSKWIRKQVTQLFNDETDEWRVE